jgi:hypothetical protein
MLKPLLVGELNPYGADPKFALYPFPRGAAGDRLCRLIMGLSGGEYMARFDRVNLCAGRWSVRDARAMANRLSREAEERPAIVLLGRKVSDAFGIEYEPFTVKRGRERAGAWRTTVVVLPHPSGLCRTWNETGAIDRARAALVEAGVLEVTADGVRAVGVGR